MYNYFKNTLIAITLIVIVSSCKTLDTNLSIKQRELPDTFPLSQDTSKNIVDIKWKEFFNDTYLTQLIDSALANNIDLHITMQRIELARANAKFAKGRLFPFAGFNPAGGMRKFGLYTMDGAGNISTEILPGKIVPVDLPDIYLGTYASWELDIWGKLKNQHRAALARYLASIEGVHFVTTNLIADVATAYFELLALDNELEIVRQTIEMQQRALEIIEVQKEATRATELAVQQFSAQVLSSKALEKEILQQTIEVENFINFLMGRYPQSIPRAKELLFDEVNQQIFSGLPSALLRNRPDIREAELNIMASKFDVQSARAAFFPSFQITGGFGFQAFSTEFLFLSPASIAYHAIGGLVAPVINMSAIKANFNFAKASQLEAMYKYQQTILNGYVEVVNELSNIQNLEAISDLKLEERNILMASINTSEELYKSARASYLEVLFAQQNALQTNLELIKVNKQQRVALVNLYRALGGGWQ